MGLGPDATIPEVYCGVCGSPLEALPDSLPLWLRCGENHFLTIRELLEQHLPKGTRVPPEALVLWSRRSEGLKSRAVRAIRDGNPVMATGLLDAALRIDDRIRDEFPASPALDSIAEILTGER
jgi:hypothetical protein